VSLLRDVLSTNIRSRTVFRVRKCYDVATRIRRIQLRTLFRDVRPFPTAATI
jgi:hypothetical protein